MPNGASGEDRLVSKARTARVAFAVATFRRGIHSMLLDRRRRNIQDIQLVRRTHCGYEYLGSPHVF